MDMLSISAFGHCLVIGLEDDPLTQFASVKMTPIIALKPFMVASLITRGGGL